MFKTIYQNNVSHVIIKYADAINDQKLSLSGNNGRKVLVNEIYENKEHHIQKGLDTSYPDFVIWKPEPNTEGKIPVLEVGYGGVEVATFTEHAKQDRHKHLLGIEIYTVLTGKMRIKINDNEIELNEKDEVVILSGTIHEVIPDGKFVTRVHSINCQGDNDKYIEEHGEWKLAKKIK